MGMFVRSNLWDFLLCIVASGALSYTVCSSFYATQPYQSAFGTLGILFVCAVLMAALFAVTWNTRTLLFGSIGLAVALVAAVGVGFATSSVPAPMEDVAGNNAYIVFVVALSALAVFVLSRRKLACIVLGVAGVFVCAAVEYLYWYGHVAALVLFAIAIVGLFALRSYRTELAGIEGGQLAFGPVAAAGAAMACVAMLAAAAVFFAVIAPFNPSNMVVKLVTEHYRVGEVEVRGIASTTSIPGDTRTNQTGNQTVMSSDMQGDQDNAQDDDPGEAGERQSGGGIAALMASLASFLLGMPPWAPLVLVVALAAIVAMVVLVKLQLRKRNFRRMTRGGNRSSVSALYLFFLDRFSRLKIPVPSNQTLAEYATGVAETLGKFEGYPAHPEFDDLTQIYSRSVYGASRVDAAERERFEEYYRAFYKRARAYIGNVRYARLFMFI